MQLHSRDKSKYIGYWENDKQNGEGEEIWQDGANYKGFYKDGQKHGNGFFKWSDGSQ